MRKPAKNKTMTARERMSLAEYMVSKQRATCKVCALPDALKEMMRSQTYPVRERLEYLEKVHDILITQQELTKHYSARH